MRKRRDGWAKAGTVFLTLSVALALTGMGYGIWSDSVSINAEMEMGVVSYTLNATDNYTDPVGGSVTCIEDLGALEVKVIEASDAWDYCGDFTLKNTGDIPLKMLVDTPLPLGVDADITDMSGDGIIDPTETESGTVRIWLTASTTPPLGSTFTVTASVVLWNE